MTFSVELPSCLILGVLKTSLSFGHHTHIRSHFVIRFAGISSRNRRLTGFSRHGQLIRFLPCVEHLLPCVKHLSEFLFCAELIMVEVHRLVRWEANLEDSRAFLDSVRTCTATFVSLYVYNTSRF